MKKIIFLLIVHVLTSIKAFSAMTNSIVTIGGGGNVTPSSSLSVPLFGLLPSVVYNVVCYIDTTFPFQYVRLGCNFTDSTSTVISYSLNGNFVLQDQLIVGHNIVAIKGQFTNPATANIVFTNLDQTNPFNVNNCFAIPEQAFQLSRNPSKDGQ